LFTTKDGGILFLGRFPKTFVSRVWASEAYGSSYYGGRHLEGIVVDNFDPHSMGMPTTHV
jgi:hypothetical protein